MKATATLIAALLTAGTASAEFFTGNQLLEHMSSNDRTERLVSDGYIMGVHDTGRGVLHCTPGTVNLTQTRDLVFQFLQQNAAIRHLAADQIVNASLGRAFPCPKRQGRGGDA